MAIGKSTGQVTPERGGAGEGPDHPIYRESDPRAVREIIRAGGWTSPTRGIVLGYAQANLVVLPRSDAFEFMVFCQRNPQPCSVLEVTDPGDPILRITAPGADVRTDVPKYAVYRRGALVEEVTDITSYWRDDFVAFLLGCSITFEAALLANGIQVRQVLDRQGAATFRTSIPCVPAGRFKGPLVVTMRPLPPEQVVRAVQVTSRFPTHHGAPVHIGDPSRIGISDVTRPDWGSPVTIEPGEVPVFWACGVTPQTVALEAGVEVMITHSAGHMFITDLPSEHYAVI